MSLLLKVVRRQGSWFRDGISVARRTTTTTTTTATVRSQSTRAEPEGSVAYESSARPFEEIPGPKGSPLPVIGTALDYSPFGQFPMKTKLMESFKERTKTYGNIYREKIGPMDLVVISDPKEIERLFRNEGRYPERQPLLSVEIYRELKKLPAGIVNLVGEEWQRVRSSVQKDLMRPKTVGAYAALPDDVTRDLVDVIRALTGKEENGGQIHNFTNYVYRWALEAISVVVLDKRLGCLTLDDLEPGSDAQLMIDGVNNFFKAFVNLELAAVGLYRYISTPTWRRFEKAINQWHYVAAKLLKEKLARSTTEEGKPAESDTDFLQSLLSREDVTFEEAMLMAVDLLAAGIDTTGNTLMFNLFCLAKNPEVQEKLYREIAEVVPPGKSIDDKTLNRMHYLRAVVKETFRVYPTVGNNLRTLDRDIVLSGYVVPAKTTIMMANDVISSLPEYYPEPEKFKPERWLRNDVASGGIPPFAMLPFGYGKRMCIGRRFAEQELHLGLIRIVQSFHVGWSGEDMKMENRFVNAPDRDSFVFRERV
ncbi:PREDICTED: LOW QUALITY PROTEIN: probable cytochrome P450 49a1 [Branchiostoma belcheri]|uniref:LOW QUALITY PROTEIN: probable cytochrome P450 49a1 n=1 Tax=Branchiostoma belcheri TaxID=7741 RepID=A0A6P4Z1I1_BRABE|nr:PREDICTED: LOW QUALITY PROTEIN: probable cytochrome P450 49a1 [Branchiostoma belcheri]